MSYIRNSFEELKKVTWPTKNQAINTTIFTIIFTLLATVLITFVDSGFNTLFKIMLENSPKAQNEALVEDVNPSDIKILDAEGQPLEGVEIEALESGAETE